MSSSANNFYQSFMDSMSIEALEEMLARKKAQEVAVETKLQPQQQTSDEELKQYYRERLLATGWFVKS